MENLKKILPLLFRTSFLCLLLVQAGCGGGGEDTEPSETDRLRDILKGTWEMQRVSVDGVDQTMLYENLTLTFTSTNYSTTNGGHVWPASGGWTFTDETGKTILRSDDVMINVEEATTNSLVLGFYWDTTTTGPGRVASIEGEHLFTFGK